MYFEERKKSDFIVSDDEDRPFIKAYLTTPKFHVGDKVNLLKGDGSHDGPYLISSITSAEKCTLSLENGEAVGGGEEFDVQKLKRVPGSS